MRRSFVESDGPLALVPVGNVGRLVRRAARVWNANANNCGVAAPAARVRFTVTARAATLEDGNGRSEIAVGDVTRLGCHPTALACSRIRNQRAIVTEADTILSNRVRWSARPGPSAYDPSSALVHQLGHVLGLMATSPRGGIMRNGLAPGTTPWRTLGTAEATWNAAN